MTKDMLNQKELDSIEKIDLANTTWWQPKIDRSDLKKLMKRKDLPAWIHTIIYFGLLISIISIIIAKKWLMDNIAINLLFIILFSGISILLLILSSSP